MKKSTQRMMKAVATLMALVMIFTTVPHMGLTSVLAEETTWADELYAAATSSHAQNLWANKTAALNRDYSTEMSILENDAENAGYETSQLGGNNRLAVMYSIAATGLSKLTDPTEAINKLNEAYGNGDVLQLMKIYEAYLPQRRLASLQALIDYADTYVFVRNKALGGSHYAYTEAVSDDHDIPNYGSENNFNTGSQLCLLYLKAGSNGLETEEKVVLDLPDGVIRDPSVSDDGARCVFSMKKESTDDYHLYELDLATLSIRQLTEGSGISDIEPSYLPDGNIVFESTRCVQTVDCWKTPVSNLYICGPNGENVHRVGYDQVTTSYTSVTDDGRVIYTRWDYNDRNQMYVQGLFQMNQDGTNQTELYGNNSSFPTTLLHARQIEGTTKYVAIASGHHVYQGGKLVIVDVSEDRNGADAITYPFPNDGSDTRNNIDTQNQDGAIYRYPYAISDSQFLVSYCAEGWSSNRAETPFDIYYMTTDGAKELLVSHDGTVGASQIVPVRSRTTFNRASMVNYSKNTGTYYMGNVYEGEAMEGVKAGEAKYLRIVALDYRTAAIGTNNSSNSAISASGTAYTPVSTANGTWDVKVPLGIVEIEEDGSCLFEVPSEVSLYFQVLNKDYELIATMRSWSTLQPNEYYSCVGCHEDNNTAPVASSVRSQAMIRGVQKIVPEDWMTAEAGYTAYDPVTSRIGFSYDNVVQPILDAKCVSCHNNASISKGLVDGTIKYADLSKSDLSTYISDYSATETANLVGTDSILDTRASGWKYTFSDPGDNWFATDFNTSSWKTGAAPFGDGTTDATKWSGNDMEIWLTHDFTATSAQADKVVYLRIFHDEDVEVFLNGEKIYGAGGYLTKYMIYKINGLKLKAGTNHIAIHVKQTSGGRGIDCGIYTSKTEKASDVSSSDTSGLFSLEGTAIQGKDEKRTFALSYLVLTQTTRSGNELKGKASNSWTCWTSCQSACEVQAAYSAGSAKSGLIDLLQSGHGNLTDAEIHAIETWIDLAVPYAGTYDENNTWSTTEQAYYDRTQTKRTAQDELDRAAKNAIAGIS